MNLPLNAHESPITSPAVEQWLTTDLPVTDLKRGRKRARSECETAGTRKALKTTPDTRILRLTQDSLDRLEAAASRSSSTRPPMGSQPERSERTELSLSGHDASFSDELERRLIYFADHSESRRPSNMDHVLAIIDRPEEMSSQMDLQAQHYRKTSDASGNEADSIQSLVPSILPVEAVRLSNDECTIANQQWGKHVLHQSDIRPQLTAPKPDQTFGFKARAFRSDRALARFRGVVCPAL